MKKKHFLHIILIVLLAVFALAALDQRMIVRTYHVESKKIIHPVRLAVVADYHGCHYGKGGERLLRAITAQAPDAILLVGDIFDDVLPWEDSTELVRSLAENWPCFYVTGNHEYWSGAVDEILRIIEEAGVTILDQSCTGMTLNGQWINFCGIPDPYADVNTTTALTHAADSIQQEGYTILLAHRPELADQYAACQAFDLAISGHAHGGQIRVPGIINGLYAPHQGWFPSYAGGLYTLQDMTMIVSRGLARESTLFPRIFNRPELVMVDLLPAKE